MEFCNWRMLLVVLLSFCFWKQAASAECPQAIFAFGASQSDTGNAQATYSYNPKKQTNPPYGKTFFNKTTTRHSDGRVIVDFFAQALKIPLLNPSRVTVDVDFTHGINFAFAGVMTQENPYAEHVTPPFHYWKQVQEFKHFMEQTIEAWKEIATKGGAKQKARLMLATPPHYFKTGLYFTTFGTNDFVAPLMNLETKIEDVKTQDIADAMVKNTEELIELGAETIIVFNVPPLGCYPGFIHLKDTIVGPMDTKTGCRPKVNEAILLTNSAIETGLANLREKLKEENLREKYKEVTIIYADFYSALLSLIENGESHGFKETLKPCCGRGYANNEGKGFLACGQPSDEVEGEGEWCKNPGSYIHWDGVHITDAAAGLVAEKMLQGKFTDPPLKLNELCQLDYTQFKQKPACYY